jgi:hypothetical protein
VKTGRKIGGLIAGGDEDATSRFVRSAVEQVVERLHEAEVTGVLVRRYYRHGPGQESVFHSAGAYPRTPRP